MIGNTAYGGLVWYTIYRSTKDDTSLGLFSSPIATRLGLCSSLSGYKASQVYVYAIDWLASSNGNVTWYGTWADSTQGNINPNGNCGEENILIMVI